MRRSGVSTAVNAAKGVTLLSSTIHAVASFVLICRATNQSLDDTYVVPAAISAVMTILGCCFLASARLTFNDDSHELPSRLLGQQSQRCPKPTVTDVAMYVTIAGALALSLSGLVPCILFSQQLANAAFAYKMTGFLSAAALTGLMVTTAVRSCNGGRATSAAEQIPLRDAAVGFPASCV